MFKQSSIIKIDSEKSSSASFKILGNNAYFVEKGGLFLLQKKKLIKKYSVIDLNIVKASNCLLVGNSLIGYGIIMKDGAFINVHNLKGFNVPFDSNSDKVYFFQRDRKLKLNQSGLYDTISNTFSLVKNYILNVNFIENDIYITAENTRVDDKGNNLWKLDLKDYKNAQITEFIGVFQNRLIVACTNHLLLSIDVYTGEVLQKWQELIGFEEGQFYKDVLPEPTDFVLDKETGKLIGVFSKYYFEIDLTSGEISYEDIRQELKQHNINSFRRMGKNPFTKEHLFVTAHADLEERPNVDLDCLLALNRNTKKVDWVHIFKDTGIGTNVPQITDTHLYQLDTEGTLHIFEKE